MTSAFVNGMSTAAFSAAAAGRSSRISRPAPAFSSAAATALRRAVEVIVAPVTASTLTRCVRTISPGMLFTARSPMPGVSECFVTRTALMRSAETSTSTATSPFLPWAEAA